MRRPAEAGRGPSLVALVFSAPGEEERVLAWTWPIRAGRRRQRIPSCDTAFSRQLSVAGKRAGGCQLLSGL
jgi:hypothetical protein